MSNLEMRGMKDHHPQDDDQVRAWLEDRRDMFPQTSEAWESINYLVTEYVEAARDMKSLEEVVNKDVRSQEAPDNPPKRLKKKPKVRRKGEAD